MEVKDEVNATLAPPDGGPSAARPPEGAGRLRGAVTKITSAKTKFRPSFSESHILEILAKSGAYLGDFVREETLKKKKKRSFGPADSGAVTFDSAKGKKKKEKETNTQKTEMLKRSPRVGARRRHGRRYPMST